MHLDSTLLPLSTTAQIVRPYDPNTMPLASESVSKSMTGPLIGLTVASLIVVILIAVVWRKRRRARR